MHFTTVTAAAVLAFAANVVAEPQPMFAVMPGMSLMRRDTSGYSPDVTKCGAGDTCSQACGAGFAQCPSNDNIAHCFNPNAKQACCTDGSGNACDEGFYCAHDTNKKSMCCPNGQDLAACAAANTVRGGLQTGALSTSTPAPTSTVVSTSTSSAPVTTWAANTTTPCASSSGYTTVWTSTNCTTVTTGGVPTMPAVVPSKPAIVPGNSGAAATGFSALLLVAAGAVALL